MKKMRIAVVSKDGKNVDEHFGQAGRFLIYDFGDTMTFVEDRQSEPLSVGDPHHSFDEQKFGRILALLKDCTKVYVNKIGQVPAAKLKESGIEPVIYAGAIASIPR
ncbi:MAG: NifB/NifX family molybdenum-iron cluster-binding protein [bacterium]